jgi:hypothetical protein
MIKTTQLEAEYREQRLWMAQPRTRTMKEPGSPWWAPFVRVLPVEKRPERGTLREWVLLAIAVGALVLSGCSGLVARPAPMGEWNCAGWRTLPSGQSECMAIEQSGRMVR